MKHKKIKVLNITVYVQNETQKYDFVKPFHVLPRDITK